MKIAAVILAAGKGTRMGTGGPDIPKVMHHLSDKPMIYHCVKLIRDAGIDRVVLVVGYKKETIEEYFGDDVEYAIQEEQLGTGHATMAARGVLDGKTDAVVVFYGDSPLYHPETVKKLIALFEKEQPTIAMLTMEYQDPMKWASGRIIRNKNGDVDAVREQKDCDEAELKIKECNSGFYIFDAEWLWSNLELLKTGNAQKEYYITDMVALANQQGKRVVPMLSAASEGMGINTLEHLKIAQEILENRAFSL